MIVTLPDRATQRGDQVVTVDHPLQARLPRDELMADMSVIAPSPPGTQSG
jgi:hypothetical protein